MTTLTAERLREVLDYDPETGVFTWRVTNTNALGHGGRSRCVAGAVAGHLNRNGYRSIGIDHVLYQAHRLAWLYVHDRWPDHHIDHINGGHDDNRIANLRDVPQAQNAQNRHGAQRNNRTGHLGVDEYKPGRWRARIKDGARQRHLGCFATPEAAYAVYAEAKRASLPFWEGAEPSPP